MVDSSRENASLNLNKPERDVSLLDLWLMVVRFRTYCLCSFLGVLALGGILVIYLPNQYEFTTAIEIGTQTVNQEVVPIEDSATVIDKLNTGYMPFLVGKYARENPMGPAAYIINVTGTENSQIVTLSSTYPLEYEELIINLHSEAVEALVKDHNRTVDMMKDNAKILLAEAEEKLGESEATKAALEYQLGSIRKSLNSLSTYATKLEERISLAEKEIVALKKSCAGDGCATQIFMLTTQIGEWRSVLVSIEDSDKINIYEVRAIAQAKLDNIDNAQDTAKSEIKYRETNIRNIKTTRSLGDGTVISIKPVSPDRPLIFLVALIIAFFSVLIVALLLDFASQARSQSLQKRL